MSQQGKATQSTLLRMAGNIAPALVPSTAVTYGLSEKALDIIATNAVALAKLIIAKVEAEEWPSARASHETRP